MPCTAEPAEPRALPAVSRRPLIRGWRRLVPAVAALLMLLSAPAAAGEKHPGRHRPPLIGAQISHLEEVTERERRRFFADLRASGFNTIIVRVFHNRNDRFHRLPAGMRPAADAGVYFRTTAAPVVADWLPGVCRAAHAEGLRVYAWMTTLSAVYGPLPPAPLTWEYDPDTGFCLPGTRFDPSRPETSTHLAALFGDLAAQPVDGILLQDDLMLRHTEGFRLVNGRPQPDPAALYQIERPAGGRTRITGYHPAFNRWTEQRAAAVETLANALMAACREVNPNLLCARNLHYETLLNPAWGQTWFAESPTALAASTADHFMIMAYQQQIRRELELYTDERLAATMSRLIAAGNREPWCRDRVIYKFQAVCWQTEKPERPEWIARLLGMLKSARRPSVVLTPYNRNHFARIVPTFAAGGRGPRQAAVHGQELIPASVSRTNTEKRI
ncbi:MAG: hypothetical protein JW781_08985 [Deltaproteobacteria bacterium]|nr:hypothetical protein [Candidatus Anaeroferrophillacea bacterium]